MKRFFVILLTFGMMLMSCDKLDGLKDKSQQDGNGQENEQGDEQGGSQGDNGGQETFRHVAQIVGSYEENIQTNTQISFPAFSIYYGKSNVISKVVSDDMTMTLDYSQNGYIVMKVSDVEYKAKLGADGLVSEIELGLGIKALIERDKNGYVSSLVSTYADSGTNGTGYSFTYNEAGVLQSITLNGENTVDVPYRYNLSAPNINIDLNWLFFSSAVEGPLSILWMGSCGKLGSKLLEWPQLFMKSSDSSVPSMSDKPAGRYLYEYTYAELGDPSDMTLQDGETQLKVVFDISVVEMKYSCYYTVNNMGQVDMEQETARREPTGKSLGTNKVVFTLLFT
ncbi:MAG: hypothetical protein J5669_00735 [Bacteroidales bacterium]|nr:hypothetical protein [Bacteroidales bacterium]